MLYAVSAETVNEPLWPSTVYVVPGASDTVTLCESLGWVLKLLQVNWPMILVLLMGRTPVYAPTVSSLTGGWAAVSNTHLPAPTREDGAATGALAHRAKRSINDAPSVPAPA